MKKRLLLLCLLLFPSFLFAQKRLLDSRQSSEYTYIYRLDDASTRLFLQGNQTRIKDEALTHEAARYLTDKPKKLLLPPGNYLKVAAVHNRLKYQLIQKHNARLILMNDHLGIQFILVDSTDNPIADAKVYAGNKQVQYNKQAETYRIKWSKKDSIYCVSYQGVSNFFKIMPPEVRNYYKPKPEKKGMLAGLWKKIGSLFKTPEPPVSYYRGRPEGYPGYIVFNKPKYKPGDTVKLKAFILQKKSKLPITDKKLMVRLSSNYGRDGKTIGYADAYRPGGFDFEFKLVDSLGLRLNDEVNIALEPLVQPKPPKKKPTDNAYGRNTPERFAYETGYFNYEDYDLKSIRLNVRVDGREQSPGYPIAMYLKAVDENDLNVFDGRVKMIFRTSFAREYGNNHVFVPDTLWQHEIKLDPIGETKLIIPDSIFPKASLAYETRLQLLNSDNQLIQRSEYLMWDYHTKKLDAKVSHDTLNVRYLVNGKSRAAMATLTQINAENDTLNALPVKLPLQLKIASAARSFVVTTADSLSAKVFSNWQGLNLNKVAYRTHDSVSISIHPNTATRFWYTIYAGKKIVDQGSALQLDYKKRLNYSGPLSLRLSTIWGGWANSNEEIIQFLENQLFINVNQPTVVSPGLKTKVEVTVKDYKGHAVPNADLTAYALTSKFPNYFSPKMPYLGDVFKPRPVPPVVFIRKLTDTGKLKLNWQYWAKSMGLDTIEYYKFTHTDSIYRASGPAVNGVTQLSPFIVLNGDILPVHILYIDEMPVYFNQSQDMHRYSFAVTPGKHLVRFRTTNRSIALANVEVKKGEKLILSINPAYSKNSSLSTKPRPDTLAAYEVDFLNHYVMGVDPIFYHNMATITQDDKVYMLNYSLKPNDYSSFYIIRNPILVGPIKGTSEAVFNIKENFSRAFQPEGKYIFQFYPDLIKEKTFERNYYNTKLSSLGGDTDYTQHPLTLPETDTVWQNYVDERLKRAYFPKTYRTDGGALTVRVGKFTNGQTPNVKAILVYENDDPNFIEVHSGNSTDLGRFSPGRYRVLFLFKNNSYYLMENAFVKPGGINFYDTGIINPHQADSVSINIYQTLCKTDVNYMTSDAKIALRYAFNQKYLDVAALSGEMRGKILDQATHEPMTGATVIVEGTRVATQVDLEGNFRIRVPKSGYLVVSIVGYTTQRIKIEPGHKVNINLQPNGNALHETVIRGYSPQTQNQTTGSSYIVTGAAPEELLQGKVAGLNIKNTAPAANQKLYIVDGVKMMVNGKDFSMAADLIAGRSELTPDAAVAIYGTEGSNGVVIITTKKAMAGQASPDQMLRRNFSDYAYWQSRLTTDAEGKAGFNVTYPDDITSWRSFVLGMNDHQQTGATENLVKSFKPLSANLVSPAFAVKGDSFSALGKVLNYTTDTLVLNRKFKYNSQTLSSSRISMQNEHIDTFKIKADGTDSLRFEYSITRNNGYFDGERRAIPLFEQGSLETKGSFDVLQKDTTITIQTNPDLKEATLRAESSSINVLFDEAEHLRNYEYLCNEQLASKLKGLLMEQNICVYLKRPFKWDKDIKDIIQKLQDNRNFNGTWGWWKGTEQEMWITLHVMEALLTASDKGYAVRSDIRHLIGDLWAPASNLYTPDRLNVIMLFYRLNPNIKLEPYVTDYEKSLTPKTRLSQIEKYRLMYARQLAGMPIVIDSLLKNMHHTMFGNVYWGKNSTYFFDNSIQESLMAYRILRNLPAYGLLLSKLRNYFLEQRGGGYWRNTYESAQILETILPDMMANDMPPGPAELKISGDKNETVSKFPYETKISAGSKITIAKTGVMPVYLIAYQKFWNPEPKRISGDFTVDTWFQNGQNRITKVKGGETITLNAEVTAKADADFVMIEIPIPAGCSYTDHEQHWGNGEVHREYFKNKVSIFCRKLPIGKYHYSVQLIPRYGGSYHVNPAKAEMMYFPVFYGREGMKMFDIE